MDGLPLSRTFGGRKVMESRAFVRAFEMHRAGLGAHLERNVAADCVVCVLGFSHRIHLTAIGSGRLVGFDYPSFH